MSYAPFTVTISTVAGALFEGRVTAVTIPSVLGMTTILAHHEPLIALLKEGTITLTTEEGSHASYPVSGGVAEVSNNRAIILI